MGHFGTRVVIAAAGLVGCAAETGTTSSAIVPSTTLDGPVMRHPMTSDSTLGQGAEVRGVLELEGECLYLAVADIDERYPVVWPALTAWNHEDQVVVLPTGDRLELGDAVAGGGAYAYAGDIERIVGIEAADLAGRCAHNTFSEIAVVNNYATAIAPA